tara:strand:- start:1046 stop:1447 length:402 start_codon:yes stop_codon:yes gene_type:complete
MVTESQVAVPPNWEGSIPEYVAYQTFIQLGREPGKDFSYQSPLMGGRMEKGGFVLDFMFANPPDLAVNINGTYYHYVLNGAESRARDIMARASMAGQNLTLIFIDDDDLLKDPRFYCREALNYRDHSRLGGGR